MAGAVGDPPTWPHRCNQLIFMTSAATATRSNDTRNWVTKQTWRISKESSAGNAVLNSNVGGGTTKPAKMTGVEQTQLISNRRMATSLISHRKSMESVATTISWSLIDDPSGWLYITTHFDLAFLTPLYLPLITSLPMTLPFSSTPYLLLLFFFLLLQKKLELFSLSWERLLTDFLRQL